MGMRKQLTAESLQVFSDILPLPAPKLRRRSAHEPGPLGIGQGTIEQVLGTNAKNNNNLVKMQEYNAWPLYVYDLLPVREPKTFRAWKDSQGHDQSG